MTAVESRAEGDERGDEGDEVGVAVGAWEAAFVSWRVAVPVIVGNAALQACTVLADPVPGLHPGFVALLLASVASLLVAVWLTVGSAEAAVAGRAREGWRHAVRRPVVMVWALGLGGVAVVASLLAVWLPPVVLAVGAFVLPAARGPRVLATALRTVVHAPIRAVVLVVVALLAAGLSAVVALLLGLFLTGAASAAAVWLWLGAVGTLLLCRYRVLTARTAPDRRPA